MLRSVCCVYIPWSVLLIWWVCEVNTTINSFKVLKWGFTYSALSLESDWVSPSWRSEMTSVRVTDCSWAQRYSLGFFSHSTLCRTAKHFLLKSQSEVISHCNLSRLCLVSGRRHGTWPHTCFWSIIEKKSGRNESVVFSPLSSSQLHPELHIFSLSLWVFFRFHLHYFLKMLLKDLLASGSVECCRFFCSRFINMSLMSLSHSSPRGFAGIHWKSLSAALKPDMNSHHFCTVETFTCRIF